MYQRRVTRALDASRENRAALTALAAWWAAHALDLRTTPLAELETDDVRRRKIERADHIAAWMMHLERAADASFAELQRAVQ